MKSKLGRIISATSYRRVLLIGVMLVTACTAMAQQGPGRGKLDAIKDPELESACKHDLDVARWYLSKRKAYSGAKDRLQEILDTYPDFSRIDEVIYLMGEVNEKLHKNDEAAKYYTQIVKSYPGSQFFKKAKDQLAGLKVDIGGGGPSKSGQSPSADKKTDSSKDDSSAPPAKQPDKTGPPPPH